jgi:glutamine synthetase
MSVFLGEQLADIFDQIKAGSAKSSKSKGTLEIGVDTLPKLPKDPGDRNRTSPFAFTGNRFEFRAVGSSQSVAGPMLVLNTVMADSLDYVATAIEDAVKGGKSLNAAVADVLTSITKEHSAVVFNGNGYSREWHEEAARRGLPNLKTTVDALPVWQQPEVVALFDKYHVLTPRESHSRYEVQLEHYIKSVNVEAKLVLTMARTLVVPGVLRYQGEVAATCGSIKAAGVAPDTTLLSRISTLATKLEEKIDALEKVFSGAHAGDLLKEAKFLCDQILPSMKEVRDVADALEGLVARDKWGLPAYEDILFII